MLYLFFGNWSAFIPLLDEKGISHGDKIIKVYTSPVDPRKRLKEENLKVIEGDDSPLNGITFDYKDRGRFSGDDLEKELEGLDNYSKRASRALIRFANREDTGITPTGMTLKDSSGKYLMEGSLDEVDGIKKLPGFNGLRGIGFHIDVFDEWSLNKLSKIVDTSEGSSELLDRKTNTKYILDIHDEMRSVQSPEKK